MNHAGQFLALDNKCPDVAILVYCLEGGGVQRQTLTLAAEFAARGLRVDYVVIRATGDLRSAVPPNVALVELSPSKTGTPTLLDRVLEQLRAIGSLTAYFQNKRPMVVLTGGSHMNLLTVLAHRRSRSEARLVLRLTTHMSRLRKKYNPVQWFVSIAASSFYPKATRIVAVSNDVRDDFLNTVRCDPEIVEMIREPVISSRIDDLMRAPSPHPWFDAGQPPVVLAIGRISRQKDFATLVRAFARLRKRQRARLIILGASIGHRESAQLQKLIRTLKLDADVDFPGFVMNPFAYLVRASVFALSSKFEGCPNVLAEAIYCGCPVVATDCPGGVRELINQTQCGTLVDVGDVETMSEELGKAINSRRIRRERKSLTEFFVETSVRRYLTVLNVAA